MTVTEFNFSPSTQSRKSCAVVFDDIFVTIIRCSPRVTFFGGGRLYLGSPPRYLNGSTINLLPRIRTPSNLL